MIESFRDQNVDDHDASAKTRFALQNLGTLSASSSWPGRSAKRVFALTPRPSTSSLSNIVLEIVQAGAGNDGRFKLPEQGRPLPRMLRAAA